MRRLTLVPILALALLAPTGVQAAPDDILVCDEPPAGTTVIEPNSTLTPAVASPAFDALDYTWQNYQFQLDLYPAKASQKSTLNVTLDWELDVNDWNLYLLDDRGQEVAASESLQGGPIGDAPTETLSAEFKHCALFTVQIFNEFAPIAGEVGDELDPLQLGITVGTVK